MNANSNDKDTERNHDAAREYFRDTSLGGGLYRSQHCGHGDSAVAMVNTMFDLMGPSGIAKMTPMYNSGVNPNYFEEYCSIIEPTDLTNTPECRTALWNEYQSHRWSYVQHLSGYHQGTTQVENREVTTVELWRRLRGKPTPFVSDWYFDECRKPGDILHLPTIPYTTGLAVLYANFTNCPVPKQTQLTLGSMHVAVGFVVLGILLNSCIIKPQDQNEPAILMLRGFQASPFSVAKSLVLWDMMSTTETKACWIVQVGFLSVWSKKATNSFIAATRQISHFECNASTSKHPPEVISLVRHLAQSKGVGLKRLIKRQSQTRKESSDTLFLQAKRIEWR